MPHSLIFNLLPLSPISPQYLSGRHLHALFLTLVSSVDKQLGNHLHQANTDKAFTLSPLQITNNRKNHQTLQWEHQQTITKGTPCWWRITLLDDSLFRQLTQLWLNLNPAQPWHLGSTDLYITSILGTPQNNQPWANACTYQQLYERASETNRSLTFNFATPTAFRQGKYDSSLPTREAIFNSLLNRWKKYSSIELIDFSLETIFPSFFDIRTAMVIDSRSKFIGCTGKITYRILGNFEPLQIKQINTLANYAFYCGVGRKTTMGMGVCLVNS